MTDHELLLQCVEAFNAIPISATARKMLKKLDATPAAYAGNGSHILCSVMVVKIRKHLLSERAHTIEKTPAVQG